MAMDMEHSTIDISVNAGVKRKQLTKKIALFIMSSMALSATIMIILAFIILNGLTKGTSTMGQSIIYMIIAGALVCAFATFLVNGFIKRMMQPIIDIAQEVELLHKGDFSSVAQIHADNTEVGQMVENIELMRSSFKAVVEDITYCCMELSKGNFTVETTAEYAGEMSKIKEAMSHTIVTLRSLVAQVGTSADQVAVGSSQVSLGAQSVSQGTMQQASAIEELSARIIEVSESVKNTANSAAMAEQLTNKVGQEMNVSDENMKEMVTAMQEISNSSSEIGKIIKAIEDIAFQTNILALNAAVEAARAGTAGKGFAVVADEVRNLATKSAEAAKDTTALIEHSIAAVENGTSIANTTAASLHGVTEGAKELIVHIDLIAKGAKEEAVAVREITEGIEQVSAVVQTNSATAEESAAASEELSRHADVLKEVVQKFKVEKTAKQAREIVASVPEKHEPFKKQEPIRIKEEPKHIEIKSKEPIRQPVEAAIKKETPKVKPIQQQTFIPKKQVEAEKPAVKQESRPIATPVSATPAKSLTPAKTIKPSIMSDKHVSTNGTEKTINDYSDKY